MSANGQVEGVDPVSRSLIVIAWIVVIFTCAMIWGDKALIDRLVHEYNRELRVKCSQTGGVILGEDGGSFQECRYPEKAGGAR